MGFIPSPSWPKHHHDGATSHRYSGIWLCASRRGSHLDLTLLAGFDGWPRSKAVQSLVPRHVFRHRAGLHLLPESPPEHPGESDSLPGPPPGCWTLQRQDGRRLRLHLACWQDYLLYWLLQWNTKKQNRWILPRPGPRRDPPADYDLPPGGRVCQVVGHTTGILTIRNILALCSYKEKYNVIQLLSCTYTVMTTYQSHMSLFYATK